MSRVKGMSLKLRKTATMYISKSSNMPVTRTAAGCKSLQDALSQAAIPLKAFARIPMHFACILAIATGNLSRSVYFIIKMEGYKAMRFEIMAL